MISFSRPQTNSSPSARNPRSPVRRYEYASLESSAIELSNTCSESSGLFQYHCHVGAWVDDPHVDPIQRLTAADQLQLFVGRRVLGSHHNGTGVKRLSADRDGPSSRAGEIGRASCR